MAKRHFVTSTPTGEVRWINPICSYITKKAYEASEAVERKGLTWQCYEEWARPICHQCQYGIIRELGSPCGKLKHKEI